ncbi:uncharacterized protein YjiS (DUF1127 family) [Tepidamorphus gemmatus]|uniref:Uncharacterized protein YjiS (DUF1127 family) n=1 Tax=Tepidamorphus gemmatus TaxID=747076 RepID=A0A4R3M8V3_9HYPH|nr:DUF1127 domain-containing protein [Tepidamorphus gemmatus]TCT09974.1 uncharacterized protein YjiS (DUF1127 family) [Tepidamorphus gemmatus]
MSTATYAGNDAPSRATPTPVTRLSRLIARIAAARRARRDLESLRDANEYLLADIGLTRGQLETALAAPFWIDPSDRLRSLNRGRGQ